MSGTAPQLEPLHGPLSEVRIVLVHALWNPEVVSKLVSGCERKLLDAGVPAPLKIAVPGAFEIPFACKRYLESARENPPDALIALGCVIRGGTPHFEFICQAVTEGLIRVNLLFPVPVIFGVLTVDSLSQAMERAGGSQGHKGEEAAGTALHMVGLNRNWNN